MKDKYIKYIFITFAFITFSCICLCVKDSDKFDSIPIVRYNYNIVEYNKLK